MDVKKELEKLSELKKSFGDNPRGYSEKKDLIAAGKKDTGLPYGSGPSWSYFLAANEDNRRRIDEQYVTYGLARADAEARAGNYFVSIDLLDGVRKAIEGGDNYQDPKVRLKALESVQRRVLRTTKKALKNKGQDPRTIDNLYRFSVRMIKGLDEQIRALETEKNPRRSLIGFREGVSTQRSYRGPFQIQGFATPLEKTVSSASILGILGGLFFLSSNITGNSIGNMTNSGSSLVGAILLAIGIIAGFFYFKVKKKF